MAADFDFEALGLLEGLEGEAREERTELIEWLLDRGFSIDHVCGSAAAPLMLPASKVLGDDGDYVSAREVCETTRSRRRRRALCSPAASAERRPTRRRGRC